MNTAAKIYLALGIDKTPAIRRIAACIACRYWMEMHQYGEFSAARVALDRLMKRFRLGDFICALSANYPLPNFRARQVGILPAGIHTPGARGL